MGNRDIHDAADGALRQQALDILRWKILDGKHKNGIFELLDSELNGERYKLILEAITQLLLADGINERDDLADKIRDGLIERYLLSHPELIEEEAAQIESESDEDALYEDARAVGMA